MRIINIHEAKMHLSRFVDQAASGEEIIIIRAGKPIARLMPLAPAGASRRLGLGKGRFSLPADFDTVSDREMERMFEAGE